MNTNIIVYDSAGNSAESNSASTAIDTENPGVTIVSPATDSMLNTNSVLIKANYLNLNIVTCEVNDNGGIYHRMNGDGFVSGVATYTFTGLTEGTHIFNVNCTDIASNSNTSITGVFIDTQKPLASIILGMPENGWVNTDSIIFNSLCNDPSPSSGIASCETFVKFGNGFFTRVSVTQGEQIQSLNYGDGIYTFKVVAKDNAGNSAESIIEVKKDTQSPSATLIVTPNGYTNRDLATFNANCWDIAKDGINSGINKCNVCLTSPSGYECFGRTGTVEMVADGTYVFSVITMDNAGNSFTLEPTNATTVFVDTVPPVTEAIAPSEWVNHDVAVVFFARDDINATIVSGIKETRACTSLSDCVPYIVSGSLLVTSEGNNLVKYYSIDNANNTESIKTSFVRIDKTAPIVNIVVNGTYSKCADGYYADSVKVLAAAYDPGSASGIDGLYYMLDNGGNWIRYPDNGVVVTKKGMSVVSFKAVDKAGNEKVGSVDVYLDKDSDTDTVYDNCDQCPTTSCSLCGFDSAKCALFKGCPAAIKADAVTQGFEVVVDKGKTKSQPVKHPIENLFVRVYNKSSGSCATQFGGTSWQNYDNIIANCEPDSYCITDATGTCIAGVEKGEYIAIGNLLAQEVNGTIELMGERVQIGNYVYILDDIKHLGSPTDYLNCGEMPIKNLKQQDIPKTNPGKQSQGLLDPIGKVLEIFVNPLEREFATAVGVVGIISITFYVLFSIVERRIKGDKN